MSEERKKKILKVLKAENKAVSASALAGRFAVSRQVIVGDIALLRAAGENITATPKGYIYSSDAKDASFGCIGTVACNHTFSQLKEELYTVVDYGGTLIDVMIEHSLYGQLVGLLDIASRRDADLFLEKVSGGHDKPLYALTGGIHLHRIGCKDKESFSLIEKSLHEKNILFEQRPANR